MIKDLTEFEQIFELLEKNELPTSDITQEKSIQFFGIFENEKLIACVGMEPMANVVLIRSLAVNHSQQGKGYGSKLVSHVEQRAKESAFGAIYLLTTTADQYFLKHDYQKLPRNQAPHEILSSSQFSHVCPISAILMVKYL
ncbi:MAG: arsenic resistance N-acetyltransferase ArsN2 [Gammaproteobacteria bacterium]|nr:arsenic resistance N-acetyltransferase ArsN2 [Gammaproteobacteria bacterium]